VKRPSRIDRFYKKPAKVPKSAKVEEVPCWHYRGKYTKDEVPVCDGKWVDAVNLRADNGWVEIQENSMSFAPGGKAKYREWNKLGAREAPHFFPPISERKLRDAMAALGNGRGFLLLGKKQGEPKGGPLIAAGSN